MEGYGSSRPAAADFLDDDAVILITPAVAQAGLQNVGADLEKRLSVSSTPVAHARIRGSTRQRDIDAE
jgi:hypothetical protein